MKQLLCILFSLFSLAMGQTTALSFSTISNDYLRPGSGAVNWNDNYVVPIPVGGSTGVAAGDDRYVRFAWNQLESDNDSAYNWSPLDIRVQIAIQNNQRFSTGGGPMPICTSCSGSSVGGGTLTYPLSLHTELQAETPVGDAIGNDGYWYINSNSPSFMRRYKRIMDAQAAYIASATYVFGGKTYHYKDVLFEVDIRGHGNFGEWHNFPASTSGSYPFKTIAAANLDSMIAWNLEAYPNYPNVILIGAFDIVNPTSDITSPVVDYALHAHNNWGPVGWRRDNWGDATNYTPILENNPGTGAGGFSYKAAIISRYQTAPIVGEPLNGLGSYADVDVEIKKYGGSSFGNGNISNPGTPSVAAAIQQASFDAGARFRINSGTISSAIHPTSTFQITLNWQNTGAAPSYEKWNATYILKNVNTVVQTWISKFQPKFFLPGSQNIVDNLSLGSIPPGNYTLYVKLIDSVGYRKPMMISNTGMQADTSYLITNITVTSGTANPPPTVSANVDQTITAPSNTATLNGSVSPNTPAVSANGTWSEVSGPTTVTFTPNANTLNAVVGNLAPGNYLLQLTGTDNNGLTATDQMQVIVNPALVAPTITGIANTTITLPSTSLAINATIILHSPATTYTASWTAPTVPGGATVVFTPSNSNNTIASGLTVAGTYILQLSVTDNNSKNTIIKDTITVNPVPTGCALCIVSSGGLDKLWTLSPAAVYCWGNKRPVIDTTWLPIIITTNPPQHDSIVSPFSDMDMRGDDATDALQEYALQKLVAQLFDTVPGLPKCKAPTVTVPNYTVQLPTNSVKISISAKGNNASGIKTYNTIQKSGITATFQNSMTNTPTISNLVAGTVLLTITVKDSCGALTNYTDTILVKPVVVPPPVKYAINITWTVGATTLYYNWSDGTHGTVALPAGKKVQYTASYPGTGAKMIVGFTDGTSLSYQ